MKNTRNVRFIAPIAALLSLFASANGAIESNFDDFVYPGTAGDGWTGPWEHTSGTPEIRTDNPIDGGTPYVHLDTTDTSTRNFMRQYEAGAGVDLDEVHTIRWKFRLDIDDFSGMFTDFGQSVQFFGRHAPRLNNRTDGNTSWQIFAAGAPHASGASAGKTFSIFDNVDGTNALNLTNDVDTGIEVFGRHVYSFAVTIYPDDRAFTVAIVNETTGESFFSEAPHTFRSNSATAATHTILHFGVTRNAVVPISLDSVSIVQGIPPVLIPPVIRDLVPEAYSIHPAADGIRFDVVAESPVAEADISLVVNGEDVSDQLQISGDPTHRTVEYFGLEPDEEYTIEISAGNEEGTAGLSRTFYTATGPFLLYDSEGFESSELYPIGPMSEVTHGRATWVPHASEPSDIWDIGPPQGKILERVNMGASRPDWLHFPPVSTGTLIVEFDAFVSTTEERTIDVSLTPMAANLPAGLVAWGALSGELAYFDGSEWIALTELEDGWHHYEMVHYLSGPAAGRFDLYVNGGLVGDKLLWSQAASGTPLGRFRLHSHQSGPIFAYGRIDNLVITAAPEDSDAFPPPVLLDIHPAANAVVHPNEALSFDVVSDLPITSGDVALRLNGVDVSDEMAVVAVSGTHLSVSYDGLQASQRYTAEVDAANAAGTDTTTWSFIVTEDPFVIFDSEGFEDNTVYPFGSIQPVAGDDWSWIPSGNQPGQITSVEQPYNKVLRKNQRGVADLDYLNFLPVAGCRLIIRFDARISTPNRRTLDMFLLRPGQTSAANQASILIWGHVEGQLTYFDGSYRPIFDLDDEWHHYEIINHLDRNRFDLKIDGEVVGTDLTWRNIFMEGTTFGRLRIGVQGGTEGDFADVDHLVIAVQPTALDLPLPAIRGLAHTGTELSFEVLTGAGVSYLVEYSDSLDTGSWNELMSIQGDGEWQVVTDPDPDADKRFYRVRFLSD